ncbi:MAG: polysaccharide biosynthesis C-terminal domain-containing protein [Christensenellales bacterium]
MMTTVLGAAMNLVLDPLFIYVFHMGVTGAAVATVISQAVSCIWAPLPSGPKAILPLQTGMQSVRIC